MKAEVRMVKGLSFIGKSDSNHWLVMDGPPELRGAGAAPRPVELLLIGLAGCTGMDAVSILLKKRAPLESFWLEADASRAEEHPKVFTAIRLTYHFEGEGLKEKDIEEAIRLSQEKYCSASAMLRKVCDVTYDYKIE
jgi:putative redox protein